MKKISFIQPSRNNLKYLKWSYNSIRNNLTTKEHEICVADDFSNDGTWEWCQQKMKEDKYFKAIRNDGPKRLGLTILYDKLVNEVITNDIVMMFHSDMYACSGLDTEVDRYIVSGTIVSMTRIEPPLHPKGPEKIIKDFGIQIDEFDEEGLLDFVNNMSYESKTTNGIFAPWAIYKKDFQEIGGHDKLFAPQSKEDSDIFNRFKLKGYKFIQTWNGFVYHMTCRGSRFKDDKKIKRNKKGNAFLKGRESDEWLKQNIISTKNFIRKWGSTVHHDKYLHPIVKHKYNIGLVIYNCDKSLLKMLEPWCSNIYVDCDRIDYLNEEQDNTLYNLNDRVRLTEQDRIDNDIIVRFNGHKFSDAHFKFIRNLPDILDSSGEIGNMTYSIFDIEINSLDTYEDSLINT